MIKLVEAIGKYFFMLGNAFRLPEKRNVFIKLTIREIFDLGISSIGLVSFLSLFMGAITALQTFSNLQGSTIPVPDSYIAYATKSILVLEFAPTIISVILAGKVGSYIASSIGTMRVSEQIDALEVMGINTQSFLILPKIVASLLFNPILIMIGIIFGVAGGYLAGEITGSWASSDYIDGIQDPFDDFMYTYAFIKTLVFAFIIATVPAYYGFYVKGGSLEVGRASTKAVVWSCILIFILNLILTQILLIK